MCSLLCVVKLWLGWFKKAVCYSVLQYVAVCCGVLQSCTVLWRPMCVVKLWLRWLKKAVCCCVLLCVAVCHSVLLCVAVRCSVLQCVAVCLWDAAAMYSIVDAHVSCVLCSSDCAGWRKQCVAACCSVLQCAAVCCSVLTGCCSHVLYCWCQCFICVVQLWLRWLKK